MQKYLSTPIPYCVWRKMNDSKGTIERWKGQVEEFKMSPSYKELLGIDAEAIEIEWNISQDLRNKKDLLEGKNPWPEGYYQVWILKKQNFLVSSPRLASGNSLRRNIQEFESLSETIRFTRVCEDATFVHRVASGMSYKTRPEEDDGF